MSILRRTALYEIIPGEPPTPPTPGRWESLPRDEAAGGGTDGGYQEKRVRILNSRVLDRGPVESTAGFFNRRGDPTPLTRISESPTPLWGPSLPPTSLAPVDVRDTNGRILGSR